MRKIVWTLPSPRADGGQVVLVVAGLEHVLDLPAQRDGCCQEPISLTACSGGEQCQMMLPKVVNDVAPGGDRVRLPLVLGPVSNGEFLPAAAGPGDVQLAEAVLARAAAAAGRLGVDRRRFLQTTGGMAALLAAVNAAACSGPGRRLTGGRPGGSYRVPAPENLPACQHSLGSRGEFIVDVHTHHVMPRLPWRTTAPDTLRLVLDMLPPDCTASNPLTCVDRSAYLHDVFLASDTTVALLSDLPSTGESNDPIPFQDTQGTRQLVAGLTRGGASRLLLQNVLAPLNATTRLTSIPARPAPSTSSLNWAVTCVVASIG